MYQLGQVPLLNGFFLGTGLWLLMAKYWHREQCPGGKLGLSGRTTSFPESMDTQSVAAQNSG